MSRNLGQILQHVHIPDAVTIKLGFGFLRVGSDAPISGVNAGRKSLLGRDLLNELAELFTFGIS